MKAGRELDALIAEKVMGWKRMTYAETYANRDPKTHGYAHDHRLTMYWHSPIEADQLRGTAREMALAEDSHDYYTPEIAWSPSRNIAHAWEVVDRVRKIKGVHGGLTLSVGSITTIAEFGTRGYSDHWEAFSEAKGVHTPHAICLAAIKALSALPEGE